MSRKIFTRTYVQGQQKPKLKEKASNSSNNNETQGSRGIWEPFARTDGQLQSHAHGKQKPKLPP